MSAQEILNCRNRFGTPCNNANTAPIGGVFEAIFDFLSIRLQCPCGKWKLVVGLFAKFTPHSVAGLFIVIIRDSNFNDASSFIQQKALRTAIAPRNVRGSYREGQ